MDRSQRFSSTLRMLLACAMAGLLTACQPSLEQASSHYRQYRDLKSLETIYRHLSQASRRSEVEALLGEPDYSPIEGQYYYASNGRTHQGAMEVSVGLVVDYRDQDGTLTPRLQTFWLGPIGE